MILVYVSSVLLGQKKNMCFSVYMKFYFVKSFYMGKMGKQDGRPGKSPKYA